jgi:hypothetical protein
MKNKPVNEIEGNVGGTFGNACRAYCQKVLAQIKGVKTAIFAESLAALKGHERILKLRLNEAEALAWQTVYPHLVFLALATEKIQRVADWNRHQRLLGGRTRSFPYRN